MALGERLTSRRVKTPNREMIIQMHSAYNMHIITNLIIIINDFYMAV